MAEKILFGTAGIPLSTKQRDSVLGVARVRELGLDAMELEFVRGVNMGPEKVREVKKAAEKENVLLSVHAPYYINLNSREKEKVIASKKRIFESARIGALAGARKITFHPAYFQGEPKKKVLEKVVSALREILDEMKEKDIEIVLAPETTGKPTQFGSLEETLEMCSALKELEPMIDFAHLHARENGKFKSVKDFEGAIGLIPKKFLGDLQMHASGINFSEKGERNHLEMEDGTNTFNYKWMLEALKNKGVSGIIICESPNIEEDALLMQKYYKKL